jgi:hypothetical protein
MYNTVLNPPHSQLAMEVLIPPFFPASNCGLLLISEKLTQISAQGERSNCCATPIFAKQRVRWCAAFPFRRDATYIITFWTNKVECISHPTGIIHSARQVCRPCVCVCMKTRFFHCAVVSELYLQRSAAATLDIYACLGKIKVADLRRATGIQISRTNYVKV